MMKKANNKLGNPAVATAVGAYASQRPDVVGKGVKIGFILLGLSVVAVGGMAFYYLYWQHRFVPLNYNTNYAPSSITPSEAKIKAESLYKAMYGMGTDFSSVYEAFKGVNYNAFIDIYNAFGKRKPADDISFIGTSNYLTLTEYLKSDLSKSELEKIRSLTKIKGLF